MKKNHHPETLFIFTGKTRNQVHLNFKRSYTTKEDNSDTHLKAQKSYVKKGFPVQTNPLKKAVRYAIVQIQPNSWNPRSQFADTAKENKRRKNYL